MNQTNLPAEFQYQMQKSLGAEFPSFIEALKDASPISIRENLKKIKSNSSLSSVPWCASGKYLEERPVFTLDPTFHAGAYYVQEASSMFLEQVLKQTTDLTQSLNVLDLCAAPGGKSTHLLSLLHEESLLISNEVIRSRASILSENIQKWGNANVIVTNNDPADFQRLRGFFDVILVDAPCSGEGLFRKDPDAMTEWSVENVDLCWKRQRRILSDIWPCLKSDGVLIYSTCTYNRLENEENLKWLMEEHGAEFLSIKTDSFRNIQEVTEGGVIGYHFYPHKVRGEGFFIAAIRKTSTQESIRLKLKNKFFQRPPASIGEQLSSWVIDSHKKTFLLWKDFILMVPLAKANEIEFITQQLHIISTGTTVGELKHQKIIPDQALALSLSLNRNNFNRLEVSYDQALRYLRKETVQLSLEKRGFSLIMFKDLPLGWVNVLDNRINNMYPANWRIRMSG